jgi:hypothetical protein
MRRNTYIDTKEGSPTTENSRPAHCEKKGKFGALLALILVEIFQQFGCLLTMVIIAALQLIY